MRAVMPPGADLSAALTPEAASAVAGAALAVATLSNAPPGFLDFLLCLPWAELGPLFLQRRAGGEDGEASIPQVRRRGGVCAKLLRSAACRRASAALSCADPCPLLQPSHGTQLAASPEQRAALVNVRLDPALMDCALDFLYR